MELYCFDGKCSASNNDKRTKYLYNPKDKLVIGYYLDNASKVLSKQGLTKMMDDLISGKRKETDLFRYLGKIEAPEREVQNILAAWKYLEMYKEKAKKLPEIYEKKEEQMDLVFNSKVKSLVDLIK